MNINKQSKIAGNYRKKCPEITGKNVRKRLRCLKTGRILEYT